jgi:hypothetical protein
MSSVNLRDLLLYQQETLAQRLRAAESFDHPVAKGDVGELNWAAVLDGRHDRGGFLPGRYAVSGAFIVDCDGEVSDQIDLVIHDAHFCPLFFEEGGNRYIPAESVYAVFEIKPELNRKYILYAGEKAESVRHLRRTSVPIVHAGGTHSAREPFNILTGILASVSGWSPPFDEPLIEALDDLSELGRLDFGATAEHGSFEVSYQAGTPQLAVSDPDGGLMFFLTHLYTRLQSLGSVTAIDLAEYARPLGGD